MSVSIGAEAGVAALVTSAMMLHEKSVRDSACDGEKVCNAAGIDANGSLAQLGGWNAAAWIVAVGGLGAGAYLLLWHPSKDDKRGPEVSVGPFGSGAGLGIRSAF